MTVGHHFWYAGARRTRKQEVRSRRKYGEELSPWSSCSSIRSTYPLPFSLSSSDMLKSGARRRLEAMNQERYTSGQTLGSSQSRKSLDVQQTTCCVVGAGPAGAIL